MKEYLELNDDGSYGKMADGQWHLTPLGLAQWMDEEGGATGLMMRNGPDTFIEAGCDPAVARGLWDAIEAMYTELERIGAVL